MAASDLGAQLTEQHRRRQLAIRAATVGSVIRLWSGFRLDDIDGSWPAVETGLLAVIAAQWGRSVTAAGDYYRTFRAAERVPGRVEPVAALPPDPTLTVGALRLAGPIGAKRNLTARAPNPADRTLTRVAGAVSRVVLGGGRDTLARTVRTDPAVAGWRRVTDASPCRWCADIAARNIVATDETFRAHDHCGCTSEPAFRIR